MKLQIDPKDYKLVSIQNPNSSMPWCRIILGGGFKNWIYIDLDDKGKVFRSFKNGVYIDHTNIDVDIAESLLSYYKDKRPLQLLLKGFPY